MAPKSAVLAMVVCAAVLSMAHITSAGRALTGYSEVTISDSTAFDITGEVYYESGFCKNQSYEATPGTTWKASGRRGICLLTKITATVKTPNGDIEATPYTSSGTSYSVFAVIQTGDNTFAVSRVVT